ncbi:coatomer subunit alpha-3-like [Dorcoceras hygrometricum]|uniref:Coatomer subunit alpha-3-like n=1 Tax=Dorcoceras hygrometricum TaxID=472368 RepID=A0A2Z7BT35_9LAMI|nr:coatomer subunit alpha-3-like [Dorcoceras hygrometricum]
MDDIIQQVLVDTAQLKVTETDDREQPYGIEVEDRVVGDQAVEKTTEVEHWFDLPYEVLVARHTERIVETASDTDDEGLLGDTFTGTDVGVQTESCQYNFFVEEPLEGVEQVNEVEMGERTDADEAMSLEDFFSVNSRVNEGGWYKADLPKIPENDKGKAPLQERDPVKGNPVEEQILLTLADIECLVKLTTNSANHCSRRLNFLSTEYSTTVINV